MSSYQYTQFNVLVRCPRDVGSIYKVNVTRVLTQGGTRLYTQAACSDWQFHHRTASCSSCEKNILNMLNRSLEHSPGGDHVPAQPLDPSHE